MKEFKRTLIQVPPSSPRGLAATTQEERAKMTVAELITLMGSLHVNHANYKPRVGSLLPIPNLAGRQPVFEESDLSFWTLCKAALRWMAR